MDFTGLGKALLVVGGLTALIGLLLVALGRLPMLGRLPGDLTFRRGKASCYMPLASSLVLSLLLTLVLNLLFRLRGR